MRSFNSPSTCLVAVASCAAITAPQPTRSQAIIELSPPALKPLPPSMQDAPVRAPGAGVVVVVPGVQYGAYIYVPSAKSVPVGN